MANIKSALNLAGSKIVVTGGAGFLGKVLCKKLRQIEGCTDIFVPTIEEYDLTTEADVIRMYDESKPDIVIHLAAEVGGIGANQDNPGRFFYANMAMGLHLIENARKRNLKKFVQVGTICAYPKYTPVPFKEESLWEGYPEETNAPYGIAKKALLVMLQSYYDQYKMKGVYVLPVNLYGPGDNFNLNSSHVIPALIRKCVSALDNNEDYITCWGTGSASREFLYVEDAADGIIAATKFMDEPIPMNLGTCMEISIKELVELIAKLTGFTGEIRWDTSKPDGQPRRCLDTSRAKNLINWQARVGFEEGLRNTINWYQNHKHEIK